MSKGRIDYIDYLKGLSIIWVVWYHTVHPWFVDFSFRIPLFFLASGIFFKVVDIKTYIQKKTNQLIVPFIFFSLIYYIYLILQTYLASGSIATFDFSCIFGVFKTHTGYESFTVNPPLWFICALFCQQILTMILVRLLKNKILILAAGITISVIGILYIRNLPTLFMFGRSLPYLIYYLFGHLYGKDLINIIEKRSRYTYLPCVAAMMAFIASIALKRTNSINTTFLEYIETFGLIIILIYLFKAIHKFRIAYPFWFYGRNSYIVLGMHEIYQTILLIIFLHVYGEINIYTGAIQTLISLLMLWPTINILNKYVPMLIGKAELINFSKIKGKIATLCSHY